MDGQYTPYLIDAWTGLATELAGYKWSGGKTVVPIDLDFNDIALMAFEKVDRRSGRPRRSVPSRRATIGFRQHIAAGQAPRTGTYSKTLTFTPSTTTS